MARKKRITTLYQRGKFKLRERRGHNFIIIYYDESQKRERLISTSTKDIEEAKLALDREYLKSEGRPICPTCQRPWDGEAPAFIADAISDYMLISEGKAGERSARTRLLPVIEYIAKHDPKINCAQADEKWIQRFRVWRRTHRYRGKPISEHHIEGSVMQLAAAINATQPTPANFKAQQFMALSRSPEHRSDVAEIAAMFRYAMEYDIRDNLLRYLRAAVATWARPDAIYDIHRDQWKHNARVLVLNPDQRRQTKKFRPTIPIPHQFAAILDRLEGTYIPVATIKGPWAKMRAELGLPGGRQAGEKLIRRSMATLARNHLGEEHWIQGRTMLGHVKATTSDIYALPNPALLGRALAFTEGVIDQIEKLAPGSYCCNFAAKRFDFGQFKRAKNG